MVPAVKWVQAKPQQNLQRSDGFRKASAIPTSRLGPNFWLSITLVGGAMITVSLAFYQFILSTARVTGTGQTGVLEEDAYMTLFLVLVGLTLAFLGVTRFLRGRQLDGRSSSIMATISSVLNERRYSWTFALSALGYGVFFAVVSSTLVYQPGVIFSETYGVEVPSIIPIVCCGPVGQVPQFVIYITQQFAILLIPTNIVLLFTVSWLVGLNASVAAFTYKNRPEKAGGRWIGGLGAIIGLFTACPTCTGFFLLALLGLSGAVSLALTLASLQGLFIIVGIPILVVAPLLTSRRIKSGTCLISENKKILQNE